MKSPHWWICTFFGIGKIPWGPGTWASLAAVPCFYPLLGKPLQLAAVLAGIYFLGVYTSTQLEKEIGEKDPSSAVIDEVLGMGVAMVAIPQQWPFVIMAFVLFRLFDIWKPFPLRRLEKLPGGWGIMTDDLMAGLYANIWIQIGAWIIRMLA